MNLRNVWLMLNALVQDPSNGRYIQYHAIRSFVQRILDLQSLAEQKLIPITLVQLEYSDKSFEISFELEDGQIWDIYCKENTMYAENIRGTKEYKTIDITDLKDRTEPLTNLVVYVLGDD